MDKAERRKIVQKRYKETHREEIRKYQAEYYRKNYEKIAKRKREQYIRTHKILTPEERAERKKQAKIKSKEASRKWYQELKKDPERYAEYVKRATIWKRKKYQNDPAFREKLRKYNREYQRKQKLRGESK